MTADERKRNCAGENYRIPVLIGTSWAGDSFTRYEPDRHVMPLAAADSLRGVAASKDRWPRDTQWRGWCATGHESASWWPLIIVDFRREYLTSSFAAHLLKASESDIFHDRS